MATRSVNIFVLMLSMSFCCNISVLGMMTNVSVDEEFELERQLQMLNKPPIKTIETEDGSIFDCVAITKQPALDHPLLNDHKVQTNPTSLPPRALAESSSATNETLQILLETTEECPVGTVPIQRTTKEHLVRARSLLDDSTKADLSRQTVVSLVMKPKFRIYGAGGRISIQKLALAQDQLSSANVWIQSGPSDKLNYIVAGWMVSPKLYGDSRTRLFTYWTADGNQKTGCYNTLCSGFVQVHRKITPTSLIVPASTYGGIQYDLKIQVFQDRKTGNWWFLVSDRNKDIPVGYWPRKLFPYLKDGSQQVAWGGIAKAGKNGIRPPMGSGHFPDGNYHHSCYFSHVHYVNHRNKMIPPGYPYTFQSVNKRPKCYRLKNDQLLHQKDLGYSFTFGGPGGKCG